MKDPYIRQANLLRVIDGDTVRLRVDLGWNQFSDHNVRFLRVNAPEMKGDTLVAAQASRDFVIKWFADHASHGTPNPLFPFDIRSEKDDAFGRYLVEVYCGLEHNIGDDLLAANMAVLYVR